MRCYTGNGTEVVNLPGVSRARINGVHEMCLYTTPATFRCAIGPATVPIVPAVRVLDISIRTPGG